MESLKYSFGKLSDRVGFSNPTIRYYEKLGLLDSPQRSTSGYRIYSEADQGKICGFIEHDS